MKFKEYIKPEIKLVRCADLMEGDMGFGSWGVDGQHQPIDQADGDEIDVFSKKHNLWDDWED